MISLSCLDRPGSGFPTLAQLKVERSRGVFLAWQPWIHDSGTCSQWTDSTSPPAPGKQALRKSLFTTPSRPLTLIYAGSCFTVSKTVVVSLRASQTYPRAFYLHVTQTRQTEHMQEKHISNVLLRKTKKKAPRKMSPNSPWRISAPFFLFHIRLLIISASRTICFWTNLPSLSNQYQQAGQSSPALSIVHNIPK